MRSTHDLIITSSRTIKIDNPLLNCRIKGLEGTSPSRIILDNNLKVPLNSNVIKDSFKYKTIIFYNKDNKRKIKLLKNLGIKIYKIPVNDVGNLDLNVDSADEINQLTQHLFFEGFTCVVDGQNAL